VENKCYTCLKYHRICARETRYHASEAARGAAGDLHRAIQLLEDGQISEEGVHAILDAIWNALENLDAAVRTLRI
jgi:hypothetical protein